MGADVDIARSSHCWPSRNWPSLVQVPEQRRGELNRLYVQLRSVERPFQRGAHAVLLQPQAAEQGQLLGAAQPWHRAAELGE